jgi:hypothetical protein
LPHGLRRVCGSRFLGLWVRFLRGHGCLSLESVVCLHVDVSASGPLLIQRSHADCDASVCDCDSIMSKPWPIGAVEPWREKLIFELYQFWTEGNKRELSRYLQPIEGFPSRTAVFGFVHLRFQN